MKKKEKLLIAGGGTGGHVLAGIAVADTWRTESSDPSRSDLILFVGAYGGMEERLVPKAGYSLECLSLGSLNRVSRLRQLKTVLQLPVCLVRSAFILLKFRPSCILGVGGYASGPIVLMSQILNFTGLLSVRVAILEQNAVPGFTNRVLSRFAHFIFSAFPGLESKFPGKQVIVSGNPIRSVLRPLRPASRSPFVIFIFGGSQGALGVNTLVISALPYLVDLFPKIQLIHQTGVRDFERVKCAYEKIQVAAKVEKFIENMPDMYAKASLLVCRSGSSTLSEIAAVGRASILVPLPTAADNHQEKNAEIFVGQNAATLFPQDQSPRDFADLIRSLIHNISKLEEMEARVKQFYRPAASSEIVSFFKKNLFS